MWGCAPHIVQQCRVVGWSISPQATYLASLFSRYKPDEKALHSRYFATMGSVRCCCIGEYDVF